MRQAPADSPSPSESRSYCSDRSRRKGRDMAENTAPTPRPEFVTTVQKSFGVVHKPLTRWERIYNHAGIRKGALLIAMAVIWELYARKIDNPLLFPTFSATLAPFCRAISRGLIPH